MNKYKNPRISIIVAAYNVEKYIKRCIDSLLNQSEENIEIIIVNDHSTDGTKDICDAISKKDIRVNLINKDVNEGLSEARNTGLMAASGDFVAFVDGDDYVEENTYKDILEKVDKTNVECAVFESYYDRANGQEVYMPISSSKKVYKGAKELLVYFKEAIGSSPNHKSDYEIGFTPWGRVYKRSLLVNNNLRFISERKLVYEDLIFFLNSFPYLNSVLIINKPLYHYCENTDSLTKKIDITRFDKVKYMCDYISKNPKYKILYQDKDVLIRYKRTILSYIRLCVMQLSSKKKYSQYIANICNDYITRWALNDYPIYKLPLSQRLFAFFLKKKRVQTLRTLCKIKESTVQ